MYPCSNKAREVLGNLDGRGKSSPSRFRPWGKDFPFFHHQQGRIDFNTHCRKIDDDRMPVLHQNSGGIRKSNPPALEISLGLRHEKSLGRRHGKSLGLREWFFAFDCTRRSSIPLPRIQDFFPAYLQRRPLCVVQIFISKQEIQNIAKIALYPAL